VSGRLRTGWHPQAVEVHVSPGLILVENARNAKPARSVFMWGTVLTTQLAPRQAYTRPTFIPENQPVSEVDPDFLEHVRREARQEPQLPWDD